MVDPSSVQPLRAVFDIGLAILQFAAAGFLAFTGPSSRPKALLAVVLALLGAVHVGEAALAMSLVSGSPTTAWRASITDLQFLYDLALVAFLATYPSPVRWRSWGGVAVAGAGAAAAAGLGAFVLARDALFTLPFGTPGSAPNIEGVLLRGGAFAVLLAPAVFEAMRRGAALGPKREREALTLLTLLVSYPIAILSANWAVVLFGGAPLLPAPAAGDCCGVTVAYALAFLAAWLGVAVWLALSRRSYVGLGLLALGFLATLPGAERPGRVDLESGLTAFSGLAPFYVVARDGAFGIEAVPRKASYALAGLVFVLVFLMVNIYALASLGDAPLGPSVAMLAGLGLGAVAAWLVLPGRLGWPAPESRLGPYRAALEAEMAAGLEGEALAAKLRGLRNELGVSEQEHVALAYGLRGAGPSGADRLAPGQLFLDRYRVRRALGRGGFATTYLCRDELVRRDVVLKRIRSPLRAPEGLEAVLGEARAVGALKHPNVVTLHDVQQVGGEAYIVMEHVEGGSLADRLRQGALGEAEFRTIADDTLAALEAVHAAGMVHRDVKPSNILLTPDGHAKLADFGVAHIRGFETTAGGDEGDGAVGTVRFMSPEAAKGRRVTPRSDLFSAAATLYEARTGQPYLAPRRGETPAELQMRAAKAGHFDAGLEGTRALRAWFARALEPEQGRRFASARDMREALRRALSDAP